MSINSYFKIVFVISVITLVGCGKSETRVLGKAPGAGVNLTAASLNTAKASQITLLQGEIVEKCPVAGCWFELRDKSGVTHVDTKAAGFVVSNIPLHTKVTVAGKMVPGTQPSLAATGLRY